MADRAERDEGTQAGEASGAQTAVAEAGLCGRESDARAVGENGASAVGRDAGTGAGTGDVDAVRAEGLVAESTAEEAAGPPDGKDVVGAGDAVAEGETAAGAGDDAGIEAAEADEAAEEHADAFELEYDEDDILYYLEDEDGNELGFALPDENGDPVEYRYAAAEPAASKGSTAKTLGREMATAAGDLNALYREGKETVGEFKEVFDDLKGMFDMKSYFK
ncbi:hypothetical protein HLV37_04670 [Eggerthellaceae bacterium zg-1084]|uniref:hypothetical protein n=1 Tax=Berryella wangjianweii TaxID=2734634 RepID=UPI0015558DF1|nr:hypothetical protein [Berryella wangjianweii]NPD31156.1 hypothetical protein [Berryella wangjianweii]